MTSTEPIHRILVLGIGNTLLQDDGIGVHVCESLRAALAPDPKLQIMDGGTIGLSLLPDLEDADAVIIVDASEIGERPGEMKVLRNEEIDRLLSGKRRTVHEVALADLFSAAAIRGRCPGERVLIAIQPASTEWGLEPTPEVRAAIPQARDAVLTVTRQWAGERAA
jgi:hydrogenase maturation protease